MEQLQTATIRIEKNKILVVKETSAMQRTAKHCPASPCSTRCRCLWCTAHHRQPGSCCSPLTSCASISLKIESIHNLETSNQFNKGSNNLGRVDWVEGSPKGKSGMVQLGFPLSANISTLDKPSAPVRTYPSAVPFQPPLMTRPETVEI